MLSLDGIFHTNSTVQLEIFYRISLEYGKPGLVKYDTSQGQDFTVRS